MRWVRPRHDRYRLVVLGVDGVQLRQTGEVAAHEHLQVLSLRLALFAVLGLSALHADPQAVHLNEVAENAVHAVVDVAAILAGCDPPSSPTSRSDSRDRGTCPSFRG